MGRDKQNDPVGLLLTAMTYGYADDCNPTTAVDYFTRLSTPFADHTRGTIKYETGRYKDIIIRTFSEAIVLILCTIRIMNLIS